jgi:hypothetical protein
MSVAEVIQEIRKLPVAEQKQVLAFLQEVSGEGKGGSAGAQYAGDSEFEKAADKVLREHAELFRRLAQ